MSLRVLIPLAKGFEEAEFIGIIDVLRRAGIEAFSASLDSDILVTGANGVTIKADCEIASVSGDGVDAIALPGGFEGMMNLKNSTKVIEIIKELNASKKLVAAICASPIVLNEAGVLKGDFSCYPGCEAGLNGVRQNRAVVVNENIITGAGPAVAILFGLEIVRYLKGEESYKALYDGLLMDLTK